jgi:hypothetical protein
MHERDRMWPERARQKPIAQAEVSFLAVKKKHRHLVRIEADAYVQTVDNLEEPGPFNGLVGSSRRETGVLRPREDVVLVSFGKARP